MTKDVILIGGAHIDIAGVPEHKLRNGEKNYGKVSFSAGGVALNVARNLSRLGVESTLLSLLCDDANSQIILNECKQYNIDISHSKMIKGHSTPNYLYIVDFDGDTHLGVSDTKLYEQLTPEFFKTKLDVINSHKVCFIDANLSSDALEYLLKNITIPTMVDPVSVDHCTKLKDIIHLAHTIKPNEKELEALCDISPKDENALQSAKDYFINHGVQNVFFSLGEKGLYYGNPDMHNHIVNKVENIVNTNGAGDAMMAALIYARLNDYDIDKSARLGMAASIVTLQSVQAGKDLSAMNIHKKAEEIQ